MEKQNILIVDDESTNISILVEILSEKYTLSAATDGITALEIVNSDANIDLILLDIIMPHMDGYEVARELQKSTKTASIPFIFLTAKSDSKSIIKGFQEGAVDYISKPFTKEELLARVQTHLKIHKLNSELIKNKNFLQSVLDYSPHAIITTDTHGIITLFNRAAQYMLGYSEDELVGKKTPQIFHDIEELKQRANEFSNELNIKIKIGFEVVVAKSRYGLDNTHEWKYITKSQKIIIVNLAVSALRNNNAQITGYLGMIEDITEKKRAEQALLESEEQYKQLFESSRDALMTLEPPTWKFTSANKASLELFGVASAAEFTTMNPWDISPQQQPDGSSSAQKAQELLAIVISDGSHFFEWEHCTKDGKAFVTDVLLTRLELRGKILVQATVRDITKRKEMEVELKLKEKMMLTQSKQAAMGEMLSMIAHQWRQPLTVIGMEANNLRASIELEEEITTEDLLKYTDEIATQTQQLSQTIDDFKNFFKPNQVKEQITIEDVFNGTLNIIGASLKNNNIALNVQNSSKSSLLINKSSLIQVLLNLIGNAKEVLLEKEVAQAAINITVNETKETVTLSICDNGGGISEDIMDKLGQPYFTTKEKLNGTGLGIYISKTIVIKHLFGTLTWHNEKLGACFVMTLPKTTK